MNHLTFIACYPCTWLHAQISEYLNKPGMYEIFNRNVFVMAKAVVAFSVWSLCDEGDISIVGIREFLLQALKAPLYLELQYNL